MDTVETPRDVDTAEEGPLAEDPLEEEPLTLAERILPSSAYARWGIYLTIAAVVAAILWFWVFPSLQHLLPEGF